MKLNCLYVHSTALGYARMGVKLAAALEAHGVEVIDKLDRADPATACNTVCWMSTPSHAEGWFRDQHPVILTMWEATVLPEGFRERLHNFAQVLVPSEQNRDLFSRYHSNVVKIPLGVDPAEWHYVKRTPPTDEFRFLIGGSGSRKGVDLAYKAFNRLWGREGSWPAESPRPVLVSKSPRPIDYFGPRIRHIGGRLTDEQERELYAQAHCYLQPSRGEGWGLQPLQAIAQGCPTILTDAHGHSEFSYLGYPLRTTMSKADYFIYGDAGEWWEPNLDDLCMFMEEVYNNYGDACAQAQVNSYKALNRFTWSRAARVFIDAIGPENLGELQSTGEWMEPEQQRYLVRVNKPWRAEVANTVYQFVPGKDYYESADLKRILFEGDVLHPSCVVTKTDGPISDIETGLAPAQLERLGEYSASQGHCLACGQKLNGAERYEPEFA